MRPGVLGLRVISGSSERLVVVIVPLGFESNELRAVCSGGDFRCMRILGAFFFFGEFKSKPVDFR